MIAGVNFSPTEVQVYFALQLYKERTEYRKETAELDREMRDVLATRCRITLCTETYEDSLSSCTAYVALYMYVHPSVSLNQYKGSVGRLMMTNLKLDTPYCCLTFI